MERQPEQRIQIEGGIYARSVLLPKNTKIPQHTHPHDHATFVASGEAILYIDGELDRVCKAGDLVEIKGGKLHEFLTTEDNTLLVCLWPESIGESFRED
jgi:quercetin dioxygenase-like cupin family protein